MNPLVPALLAQLLQYAREIGEDYMEKGLDLIMETVTGEVSDERLLAFLRERAKGDPQ